MRLAHERRSPARAGAAPPELSPLQTESTAGNRFIESAGRGCLGTVSFIIAILIFGTISAANQIAGLTLSLLAIAGMVEIARDV